MEALLGVDYRRAFDTLLVWTGSARDSGRQLAHAMAHGSYACRAYVVIYHEDSGTFGLVRVPA